MIKEILSLIFIAMLFWYIFKGNIAVAIITSVIMLTDYQAWIRGGNSMFFGDITQTEKDLREIQKLEIKQKLEKLKNETL